jgi:hypothetical protein
MRSLDHRAFSFAKWAPAYAMAIDVSEGEFDKIKPPEGWGP